MIEMKKNDFGKKLKMLRGIQGETQKNLADKCGVAHTTLSKYEKNERRPDSDFLTKLRKTTNVNLNWLLGEEQDIDLMFTDSLSHSQLREYLTQLEILFDEHQIAKKK